MKGVCNVCGGTCVGSPFRHCCECEDYDICEACFCKGEHCDHPTYICREPIQAKRQRVVSCCTLADCVWTAFCEYGNQPCVGRVTERRADTPLGFMWETYAQVKELSLQFVGRLRTLDAEITATRGSDMNTNGVSQLVVAICAKNSLEWLSLDLACCISGFTTVTINPHASYTFVSTVLAQCGATLLFCDTERIPEFSPLMSLSSTEIDTPTPCQRLKYVVDVDHLEEIAASKFDFFPVHRRPGDIVSIIYTSGSTGSPKGVPFYEKSLLWVVQHGMFSFDPHVEALFASLVNSGDRKFFYRTICSGGRVGLVDKIDLLYDYLRVLGPTYMIATPRFYEVLFVQYRAELQQLMSEMQASDPFFHPSLVEVERQKLLARIKTYMGKRLKSISIGGAAVSPNLLSFLKECFGSNVASESFGCTETGTIALIDGQINKDNLWKIIDWPEMNYFATDKPYPRGEICVKTPIMATEYYNNPTETAFAFDSEGFFHTGDIVEVVEPSRIRIVDRKKFIFKLSQGEFIAPQSVEEAYSECPLVQQIFITCENVTQFHQHAVIAIVVPNETQLRRTLKDSTTPWTLLVQSPLAHKTVMSHLVETGKRLHLRPFEVPALLLLEPISWTIESGLLTVIQKKNRPSLDAKYQSRIRECFITDVKPNVCDLQPEIESIISSVLSVPKESLGTPGFFLSHGGDSLSAMKLTTSLSEKLGIQVPPSVLFDAGLSIGILPMTWGLVFVSGSTCADLLVYICLLGLCKLRQAVQIQSSWTTLFDSAIEQGDICVVQGDCTLNNFGLSEEDFVQLASRTKFIYHIAADVNHIAPYSSLRKGNVIGTCSALHLRDLSCSDMVHVSSASVANSEGLLPLDNICSKNGYTQSKWVAEKIVSQVSTESLCSRGKIFCVRLGFVGWNSETGDFNRNDWLTILVKGVAALSCFPQFSPHEKIRIVAVDHVCNILKDFMLARLHVGAGSPCPVCSPVNVNNTTLNLCGSLFMALSEFMEQCVSASQALVAAGGATNDFLTPTASAKCVPRDIWVDYIQRQLKNPTTLGTTTQPMSLTIPPGAFARRMF
ncbi:long-chain fatty-acid-CoA ligase FadD9 [Pelomyxa schiedti]|nr:long-chain fatty-acid-CoA ligase FadD9 [Pelomyxa schiedti]